MRLSRFEYREHVGAPTEWILEPFDLGAINLFVGKNSTGKTRLVSVISNLAKLITGDFNELFSSGSFVADFTDESSNLTRYELVLEKQRVANESLFINGERMFARDEAGKGSIKAEKLEAPLEFEVATNALVVNTKRDKAQHGFLEVLHGWASSVRRCDFGTSLGRDAFKTIPDLIKQFEGDSELLNPTEIHELYQFGFRKFERQFDELIISWMADLGYEIEDVGLTPLDLPQLKGIPLATLFVKEKDLTAATTQVTMSQGMFRALALAIRITFDQLDGTPRTIVIDDIGEGLDFERSRALVKLLVTKAKASNFQVLMTTNDRFVMNGVDLDYWCVMQRHKSVVSVINKQNKPDIFEDFENLGLSNFDFFSTKFFETGLVE